MLLHVTDMAAYQKCGVIIVTVLLAVLRKINLHNYRLFIAYEEIKSSPEADFNLTTFWNGTRTLSDDDNVSQFLFKCLLVNNCLAIISCICLTSWSDKHGRKLLLILPYIGSFLSDIVMVIVLFLPEATSKVLLVSEAVDGFFGGTVLISLGCLCYITDSTDHRERTLSIAIYFGLWNMVPVIDMAIQYFWTPEIGLSFTTLILSAAIYRMVFVLCFLIYIKFCISESVFILGTYEGNPWTNLVTPINVSDTISCVFKRRLDNMRVYVMLLTGIFIFYTMSLFGDMLILPEYFRNVFLWPYNDMLAFSSIVSVCQTLTLWFSALLAKEWKSLDTNLGIYGCVSLAIAYLALIFSNKSYLAGIGVITGIGSLFVPLTVLSVLSKLVERNEIGNMFAGIGFITLITEIAANASYSTLNDVCQDAGIPQMVFLLSFAMIAFSLLCFIYLKRNLSPHLIGHLTGSESLALINRKGQIEQLFE